MVKLRLLSAKHLRAARLHKVYSCSQRGYHRELAAPATAPGTTPVELGPDFSRPGPCAVRLWHTKLFLPPSQQATITNTLTLDIPIPEGTSELQPPFPVIIFFSGFQARASYYRSLAERAGSWGLVTVQYDTPLLRIFNVSSELRAFEPLVDWLAGQNDSPSSPLHGLLDLGRLTVGGHSRGGKLATLLYAGNPSIKAAFLVDPVDCTIWSPESRLNPSATKALAASGREAGIVGAGVINSCNPEGGNYKNYWAATAPGSWLAVLRGTTHLQYMDGGPWLNPLLDLLSGRGVGSREEVAHRAAAILLAWTFSQLQQVPSPSQDGGDPPHPAPLLLLSFLEWVAAQEAAGKVEFAVKGGARALGNPRRKQEGHREEVGA